jgi:hypothetical protein
MAGIFRFDLGTALDNMLEVFWRQGYNTAPTKDWRKA